MKEKTKNKSKEKTGAIGIFDSISKNETSFFEKQDNSWWWTLAILFFLIGLACIWAYTTFGMGDELLKALEKNEHTASIYSKRFW